MILEIVVSLLLVLSVWLNVFLIKKLLYVSENINDVGMSIEDFTKHISKVNSLEMYYGDETLSALLEHSLEVVEDIKNFQDRYGGDFDETNKEKTSP